jgi:hypothetical protein
MNLALLLVVAAILALVLVLRFAVSRSLEVSSSAAHDAVIEPLDIEAFRNLVSPAEDAYLRGRLPASEFRTVRRARLHACAAYVRTAARNAATLTRIGQTALASPDARTVQAAQELIDQALLLRRNATVTLIRIYIALAWPNSGLAATPILDGYRDLSGSAMLLGRLQNPAVPVRISAT